MDRQITEVLGARPLYIDFLAESLAHMLMFRSGAEYALQNASYMAQRRAEKKNQQAAPTDKASRIELLDIANGSLIEGNLAKIVLTCNKKSWGVDWIAPSFTIKQSVLAALTSEQSQVVLTSDDGSIKVNATQYVHCTNSGGGLERVELEHSFSPQLAADCNEHENRTHDSEHLLLNFLDYLISNNEITPENGEQGFLSLVSERIPCSSCTRNIKEFLSRHDWITLRLFYFYDTKDRGPQQFLQECTDHGISAIEKIALSTTAHIVSVDENPHLVLSQKVVEQQRMFGGAPNQVIAAIKPN